MENLPGEAVSCVHTTIRGIKFNIACTRKAMFFSATYNVALRMHLCYFKNPVHVIIFLTTWNHWKSSTSRGKQVPRHALLKSLEFHMSKILSALDDLTKIALIMGIKRWQYKDFKRKIKVTTNVEVLTIA